MIMNIGHDRVKYSMEDCGERESEIAEREGREADCCCK
jgi:hypothetical protein